MGRGGSGAELGPRGSDPGVRAPAIRVGSFAAFHSSSSEFLPPPPPSSWCRLSARPSPPWIVPRSLWRPSPQCRDLGSEGGNDGFGEAGDPEGLLRRHLLFRGCSLGKRPGVWDRGREGTAEPSSIPSPPGGSGAAGVLPGFRASTASGSLETAAFKNCGHRPQMRKLGAFGFGFVLATSFSPLETGAPQEGGAGRGPSGWACQFAESASPAPFAGVAWSPGECDLLTKVACCLHSTAGGGGGGVEREPSAPFSPSGASVSPSAK